MSVNNSLLKEEVVYLEKKRIEYLDTAKGILIILMVFGHVFVGGPVFQYIYSFHMPAFFIISGILLNFSSILKKTIYDAFKSKICTLIIPLLFFEIIGVFTDIARFGITLNVFGYATNTLILDFNNGPSWFLWALFVDEMLFIIIYKYIKIKYIRIIVSVSIGLIMATHGSIFPLFESTGVGLLFVTFGYCAYSCFMKQKKNIFIIFAGLLSVATNAFNGNIGLGSGNYGNSVFLYIIAAISGTYLVIHISKMITFQFFKYFGQNTLTVVGTHQAVLLLIRTYTNREIFSVPFGIGVFTFTIMLEVLIIYIFNRFVPFFVGKKKISCTFEKLVCYSTYFLIPMVILVYVLRYKGYM